MSVVEHASSREASRCGVDGIRVVTGRPRSVGAKTRRRAPGPTSSELRRAASSNLTTANALCRPSVAGRQVRRSGEGAAVVPGRERRGGLLRAARGRADGTSVGQPDGPGTGPDQPVHRHLRGDGHRGAAVVPGVRPAPLTAGVRRRRRAVHGGHGAGAARWAAWWPTGARRHKQVAVAGYGLSAVCKLGLVLVGQRVGRRSGAMVLLDRTGKGIRTAPRDAMISLSTPPAAARRRRSACTARWTPTGAMAGPVPRLRGCWPPTPRRGTTRVFVVSLCAGPDRPRRRRPVRPAAGPCRATTLGAAPAVSLRADRPTLVPRSPELWRTVLDGGDRAQA